MQSPLYSIVPQEEIGPEKFESIEYMNPQDVVVAKELTMKFGNIFPDGFVRDSENSAYPEESPDEKIINAIFLADDAEEMFDGNPPEKYKDRYNKVQAEAEALKGSPDLEIADKALKTDAALKWMKLFVETYEGERRASDPDILPYGGRYSYMRSLYDMVVQPALLKVGRNEADLGKIISDMAAVEAKHAIKKHTPLVSLRDAFAQSKDVPPEKVLDYNNSRIRRFS